MNIQFSENKVVAILGKNGSGKSTLLQIIAGYLSATKGEIEYQIASQKIERKDIYKYISLCAPYLELIEEYTITEMLEFHFQFIKKNIHYTKAELEKAGLDPHLSKQIKELSSGLKQRVKLVLALFSEAPILLLDEPTMNLDQEGIDWYKNLLLSFASEKMIFISSNDETEYQFLNPQKIFIEEYKN